jgi:hypothetical protein
MEAVACRTEAQITIGNNGGSSPAIVLCVRDAEHVIGEGASKHKLVMCKLLLGLRGFGNLQLSRLSP